MLHKPTLHLPASVTVTDVADAARLALTQFLVMDAEKRALSAWLVGPYGRATAFAPHRSHSVRPPASVRARSSFPPPELAIEELVEHAKSEARATLTAAVQGGPEALVQRMPSVVQVIRVDDAFGGHGFAPIDAPKLKLSDRLLSLLVADFLTRPDDFAREMASYARPPTRTTRSGFSVRPAHAAVEHGDRDKDTG